MGRIQAGAFIGRVMRAPCPRSGGVGEKPPKHTNPRKARGSAGDCCLGSVGSSIRPTYLSARDVATSAGSFASISTYVRETWSVSPEPFARLLRVERRIRGTLGTGCIRADRWSSEADDPSSTPSRVPGTTVSGHTGDRFRPPHPLLTEETPGHLPASYRSPCGNWLHTRVKGPSDVDPSVHLRCRTLTRPVHPLRTLRSASEGGEPCCDISLRTVTVAGDHPL